MNYLTNYYKNLSEQLQEKVNHLEKILKEGFNDPKIPHDAASREYAEDINREWQDIARGEEEGSSYTPKQIRDTVDFGFSHIASLRKHPRISSEHLDKIKDFEKLLKQHKENSFSETNPEVHNSIHDNVYSILDELEIINDELDKKGISK